LFRSAERPARRFSFRPKPAKTLFHQRVGG
jgi:hypothetical protein